MIRRYFTLFLSLLLLCIACVAAIPTSAADTIYATVNIAVVNQNVSGAGYSWANRDEILTLNGLNIQTEEDFGLRLPKYCTVVLKGNNYIKAGKYGISCAGTVIFKGSGTLTIDAGEIGIYLISQDSTQKVRLIDGKYHIKAGTYGVYSEAADFSFLADSMDISVADSDGKAILGRSVNLLGGSFAASAPVEATHQLLVDGIDLDISAGGPALSAKYLTVKNLSEAYDGENAIQAVSTKKDVRSSILFGEDVPAWVDYMLLALAAVGIGAAVVIPIIRKKKKTEELYRRLEQEGYR